MNLSPDRTVLSLADLRDQPQTTHVVLPYATEGRTAVAIDTWRLTSDGQFHGFVAGVDEPAVAFQAETGWIVYRRPLTVTRSWADDIRQMKDDVERQKALLTELGLAEMEDPPDPEPGGAGGQVIHLRDRVRAHGGGNPTGQYL